MTDVDARIARRRVPRPRRWPRVLAVAVVAVVVFLAGLSLGLALETPKLARLAESALAAKSAGKPSGAGGGV